MILQCESCAYADSALKAAQRAVPLAIVHGKNDPVVPYEGGTYAHGLFLDAGWPAIRLFGDDTAAHMFARLPVGPAIRWLEVMTSENPIALLEFAEHRLKELCIAIVPPGQEVASRAEVINRHQFFSRNEDTAAFISRSRRRASSKSRTVPWSRPGMISTTASLFNRASESLRSWAAPSR